jgi:hypothetical protein
LPFAPVPPSVFGYLAEGNPSLANPPPPNSIERIYPNYPK